LSDEQFVKHKEAVATNLSVKPKNYYERACEISGEILRGTYNFTSQEKQIAELERITQAEVSAFYRVRTNLYCFLYFINY